MAKNKPEERNKELPTITQLMKEVEKLNGKVEILEGNREEMNERFSAISESVGDLRRMILDREESESEMVVEFEKIKASVEDIEPQKFMHNIEKLRESVEKLTARVEKNEYLFNTVEDEVRKAREVLSKFRSFENLVKINNKIKQALKKTETNRSYTERMAAKSEGIFSELNDKLNDVKLKLDTIEKVDSLTKEIVKQLDQINIKIENDMVKREDLEKLGSGQLPKSEKKAAPPEDNKISEEIKNKVKELSDSLKAIENKEIEQQAHIKEIAKKLESASQMFKSPEELLEERKRIRKLLERVELDYKKGSLKRDVYKEIVDSNKARLEIINSILEKISDQAIYEKIENIENEITTLIENDANNVRRHAFDKALGKITKEIDLLSENVDKIGKAEKSINELLAGEKLTKERIGILEKRTASLQHKMSNISRINQSIKDVKNLVEHNKEAIEKVVKLYEEGKDRKDKRLELINKKVADIFSRLLSIERMQDELIDYKEKVNPADIKNLLRSVAKIEAEIENLKNEKADFDDIARLKKSFDDIVRRNTEIIEKFIREDME